MKGNVSKGKEAGGAASLNIVQTTGNSENAVMSQKAMTENLRVIMSPDLIYIKTYIRLNTYVASADGKVGYVTDKTRCAATWINAVEGSWIKCADGYEVTVFKYDDYPFTTYEKYTGGWASGNIYLSEGVYNYSIRKSDNSAFDTVGEAEENVLFYLNKNALEFKPYKMGLINGCFHMGYTTTNDNTYPVFLEKGTYISSNILFALVKFDEASGTATEDYATGHNIYYIGESGMYVLRYSRSRTNGKEVIISTKEMCTLVPLDNTEGNIINTINSNECYFRLSVPINTADVSMIYIIEWKAETPERSTGYSPVSLFYKDNKSCSSSDVIKWSTATPIDTVYGTKHHKRAYAFCVKENMENARILLENTLMIGDHTPSKVLYYNAYTIPENALGISSIIDEINGSKSDEPQSLGVLNALLRAKQLCDVEYTPIEILPNQSGDFPAGKAVKGLPYSSTREIDKMIGINVSLYTFMTAIQNPKAKIYTETLTTSNSKCYYGIVCSSFTNYCLDLPYNYTTTEIPRLEGMKKKHYQDVKLGDLMIKSTETQAGHIIMITGITRDTYGRVKNIEITEGTHPKVTRTTITFNKYISDYIKQGYELFEFDGIADVGYTASSFIPLMDEPVSEVEYPDIICDLGDKATCKAGETISANVINGADYTSIEVYKDGSLISTHGVEDITFENISAGSYEVRLVSDTKTSSTFFIAVDYSISKEGERIYFASANSKPLNLSLVGTDHGNRYIIPLTEEDIANSYKDVDISQYAATISYIKFYFENEYGSVACKLEL